MDVERSGAMDVERSGAMDVERSGAMDVERSDPHVAEADDASSAPRAWSIEPDLRHPRMTLLFDVPGPTDLDRFRAAVAERRGGGDVKLSSLGSGDRRAGAAAHARSDEGGADLALTRIGFDECVIELLLDVPTPAPGLDDMLARAHAPDADLDRLRAHGRHVVGRMLEGPDEPLQRQAACLDVAAALVEQGLVGVIQTDACACLTAERVARLAEAAKDPRADDELGFDSFVSVLAMPFDDVDYWVTRGSPLWGLPELVVPLPRGDAPIPPRALMRDLFLSMRRSSTPIEPPQTTELGGIGFRAHPAAVLGTLEPRIVDDAPAIVWVADAVAALLGLEPIGASPVGAMARALVATFSFVSSADGAVDRTRLGGFVETADRLLSESPGLDPVRELLRRDPGDVLDSFLRGADPIPAVEAFARLADATFDEPSSFEARRLVYLVGHEVAAASGRSFFGLGSRISRAEDRALTRLAQALRLE